MGENADATFPAKSEINAFGYVEVVVFGLGNNLRIGNLFRFNLQLIKGTVVMANDSLLN